MNRPRETGRPLRVVVADDQASVREGLSLMLDLLPDIDVVGSAAEDGKYSTWWPS